MKLNVAILLLVISCVSEAYEVSGHSSLAMDKQTTVGLEALGVEAAKVNALDKIKKTISKGDQDHLLYSYLPSIQELVILSQNRKVCEVGYCLETKIKIIVDEQILDAISQKLQNRVAGFSKLHSEPQDVLDAQIYQFSLIESRYSHLPIQYDAEDGIYSQWLRLRAKEQQDLVKRIQVSQMFKDISPPPQRVELSPIPVFDFIGKSNASQYIGYAFSLPGSQHIQKLAKSSPFLISDTRYVTMKLAITEQVEFRAKYQCLMFVSADEYIAHKSVATAQLFHQEPEVVIEIAGEVFHIGRGYYFNRDVPSESVIKRSGIPAYCELRNGEFVFKNSNTQASMIGTYVSVINVVRMHNVDTDFHGVDTNMNDWLLVDSNFNRVWVKERYTQEIQNIRQGCIDSVCISHHITPKQFMSMVNGQPHVALSNVAAGMRYPLRIERYQPTRSHEVPYVGLQTAGYGTGIHSLEVGH